MRIHWSADRVVPLSYTLDTTADPRHIDMVGLEGPTKGSACPGIYRLEGDRLLICCSASAMRGRPQLFGPGGYVHFLVLERVKP